MEERKQEVEGDPGGAFYEQLLAALYPDSPEGRPTIGSEDEIAALTRDKAMAFYRAHYAPNNAVLVVAGDVGTDEVRQLAERHFAAITVGDARRPPRRPPEPPRPSVPRIEVHDARVPLPQLTRLYLAPRRRAGDQTDAAALVVLADLLGAPRATSIMARDLVRHDGIALAAEASYSPTGHRATGVRALPRARARRRPGRRRGRARRVDRAVHRAGSRSGGDRADQGPGARQQRLHARRRARACQLHRRGLGVRADARGCRGLARRAGAGDGGGRAGGSPGTSSATRTRSRAGSCRRQTSRRDRRIDPRRLPRARSGASGARHRRVGGPGRDRRRLGDLAGRDRGLAL